PMFHTLERKHTASPSAISTSGTALTVSSESAYALFTGSMKNTCRPRSGSLPSKANSVTPTTTVTSSASSGEPTDHAPERCGRASSRSMGALLRGGRPQARHPFADALDRGIVRGDRRRHTAARDHHQPVADLEQLVELFADHQQRAAFVTQAQQ